MFSASHSSGAVFQLAKAARAGETRPVLLLSLCRLASTSSRANAAQVGVCPIANHGMGSPADTSGVLPRLGSKAATVIPNALSTAKPYGEMPGPKGLPILGSLLDYTKLGHYSLERMHEAILDRFEKYGPIYKENIAGAEAVHILDPKDVAELFRNEGATPRRIIMEPMAHYRKVHKKNCGIANLQGEQWRKWRSAVQQIMLKPTSVEEWIPRMESCAYDFIELMRSRKDHKGEIPDYHSQIHKWALESSFSIIFGKRIGCLVPNTETNADAAGMIEATTAFFNGLCHLTFGFPLYKYGIQTRAWTKFAQAQDNLYNTTVKYVNEYAETLSKEDVTSTSEKTENRQESVLSYVLQRNELEFEDVCSLTNDLILAAIDTTSNLMSFCLYCLAKNPEVQERLHVEVNKVLPGDTSATAEALQRIPYLEAFVKETTRIFPPVDGTSRLSNHDIAIRGYRIPANTLVRVHCLSGLMTRYFKEPQKFKPERWIRGDEGFENIDPFLVLPFGTGSRMCLGRRMAKQDIFLLLARIVQRFKVEWHHEDLDYLFRLTNVPSRPLQLSFIDRA